MRACAALLLNALLIGGCSLLASLDDLQGGSKSDAGACQPKVDCSSCASCQSLCVCIGAADLVA